MIFFHGKLMVNLSVKKSSTLYNILDCVYTVDDVGESQFKEVCVQPWAGHESCFQCENNRELQPPYYVLFHGLFGMTKSTLI